MNRLFFIILFSLSLYAEQKKIDYVNEMTLLIGNSENGFTQNVGRSIAYGLQFQYNGLDFPIKPEIEFVYSQDIPLYDHTAALDTRYSSIMANGVYEIPYSELITPYVKAGLGYTSYANVPESPSSSAYLDTGAGVKLHLTDRLALKFQVLTQFNTEEFNLVAAGGISFAFGRKYVAPPPEKVCSPCPEKVCEAPKTVYVTKEPEEVIKPYYVQFAFAKTALTDESKKSIKDYINELNSDENIHKEIIIIGNTDSSGPRSFNATLSIKRANIVRAEFIANNVDAGRITVDALGETYPVADNKTEHGREENRRVIVIVKER